MTGEVQELEGWVSESKKPGLPSLDALPALASGVTQRLWGWGTPRRNLLGNCDRG